MKNIIILIAVATFFIPVTVAIYVMKDGVPLYGFILLPFVIMSIDSCTGD